MYGEGIAGHIVARFIMTEEQTCKIDWNFWIKLLESNNLIKWIAKINNNQNSKIFKIYKLINIIF